MAKTMTMTPADILKLQSEYVRTGKYLPLGRMQKISIGPAGGYTPPDNDPYIRKYGRMIELRDRPMPIAYSLDRSMILVTAPLIDRAGRVALPDVPVPDWVAPTRTKEEIEGYEVELNGQRVRISADQEIRDGRIVNKPLEERFTAKMIPQNLRDRTNVKLDGSNFLVFEPVERIVFQPELESRLIGTAWWIDCKFNPMDRTYVTLLVDEQTGETHFFGGSYEVCAPSGS